MRATVPILLFAAALGVVGCGLLLDLSDFDDRADGGASASSSSSSSSSGNTSSGDAGAGGCAGSIQEGACTDDPCPECAPAGDLDCDGLLDAAQDPWPQQANLGLLSDTGVSSDWWVKIADQVVFEPAGARISSGGRIELAETCSKAFSSPHDLTEVVFQWESASITSGDLHVYAAATDGQYRICSLNDAQMMLSVCKPADNCSVTKSTETVKVFAGATFLLQTYATGIEPTHHCRLFNQDGTSLLAATSQHVPETEKRFADAGTIAISSANLTVLVQRVRQFRHAPSDVD